MTNFDIADYNADSINPIVNKELTITTTNNNKDYNYNDDNDSHYNYTKNCSLVHFKDGSAYKKRQGAGYVIINYDSKHLDIYLN